MRQYFWALRTFSNTSKSCSIEYLFHLRVEIVPEELPIAGGYVLRWLATEAVVEAVVEEAAQEAAADAAAGIDDVYFIVILAGAIFL